MGKSDKKVESERVRALRKKFEAFFEEEKKRKERNDYILGKLDKMSTLTAVIPQCKTRFLPDVRRKIPYNCPLPFIETVSLSQSHQPPDNRSQDSQVTSKFTNDSSLVLNEIIKKYILIPRSTYSNETEAISASGATEVRLITDDTDWKSKYEILNQLKKDEKEQTSEGSYEKILTAHLHPENTKSKSSQNQPLIEYSPLEDINVDNKIIPNLDEIPVKRVFANETVINIKTEENKYNNCGKLKTDDNPKTLDQENKCHGKVDVKLNEDVANLSGIETNIPSHFDCSNVEINQQSNMHKNDNEPEVNYQQEAFEDDYEKQQVNTNQNDEKDIDYSYYNNNENTSNYVEIAPQENEFCVVETISLKNVLNETNITADNQKEHNDNTQLKNEDYPIEIINPEEFTPGDGVVLTDGVNINPEGYDVDVTSNSNMEINLNSQLGDDNKQEQMHPTSGATVVEDNQNTVLDEFEAEQRDMWYAPNTNENVIDNQEAEEVNYEQQTDQYYYQQEQNVPAEINEHEETQQNYDPNYEQQYSANYGNEYTPEAQHYEQQANYEGEQTVDQQKMYEQDFSRNTDYEGYSQEEYDQYQQLAYETPQDVEHQLDTEQNYTEKMEDQQAETPHVNVSAQEYYTEADKLEDIKNSPTK